MGAPSFHHCGGDIFDDAGQVITLDEAADLAVTFAHASEVATNTAVIAEMARAATSVCNAMRECMRWHRASLPLPEIRVELTPAGETYAMFASCPEVQPETAA